MHDVDAAVAAAVVHSKKPTVAATKIVKVAENIRIYVTDKSKSHELHVGIDAYYKISRIIRFHFVAQPFQSEIM